MVDCTDCERFHLCPACEKKGFCTWIEGYIYGDNDDYISCQMPGKKSKSDLK